jgi:RNA polymerase sigma-70 factor (ECF subfamily)
MSPGSNSSGDDRGVGDVTSTTMLFERARKGDRDALESLFARSLPALRRWASGRLPRWARSAVDTQDLVQETALQVFKRIDAVDVRQPGALQAYLRQAVLNRIRNELRRFDRRGPNQEIDSQLADAGPSPLEAAIGSENVERYEAALERLSPADREAVIGRLEMGYSYQELADTLGKPTTDAARKATQRAVVRLAAELKRGR